MYNFFIGIIAGLLIAVGILALSKGDNRFIRKELIKRGYAEYYLNENNKKQWRWIERR